jgi:hypothetical protein
LEAAIGRHAWRLREVAEPTLPQLRELIADDLDPSGAEDRASDDLDPEVAAALDPDSVAQLEEPTSEPG